MSKEAAVLALALPCSAILCGLVRSRADFRRPFKSSLRANVVLVVHVVELATSLMMSSLRTHVLSSPAQSYTPSHLPYSVRVVWCETWRKRWQQWQWSLFPAGSCTNMAQSLNSTPPASTKPLSSTSPIQSLPSPLLALIASHLPGAAILSLQRCSSTQRGLRDDEASMLVAWRWATLTLSTQHAELGGLIFPDLCWRVLQACPCLQHLRLLVDRHRNHARPEVTFALVPRLRSVRVEPIVS